ncbi:MAG: beta-galactosidase, partial [Firmicutes bacterium]|nr:beta-galactosidase [Bacillota bacterium]
MNTLTYDHNGFQLDGRDDFMISGEFHYFRVPREDWKYRMQLFKDCGGNTLATYVPWIIHEPEEGRILFGDVGPRDLEGFLKTAAEVGLKVILRPGPYSYSELVNAGLPQWILDKYPETLARSASGAIIHRRSVSYLHPVFLEKSRRFYKAFADLVRPYMAQNGGPVEMIQVDNELAGIHVWYGSKDCNLTTIGFGDPKGRFPLFLQERYETVQRLNATYGTAYPDFAHVEPFTENDPCSPAECLRHKDYSEFYMDMMAEYLLLLAQWLREDGIEGPICHNSANPSMNHLFVPAVQAFRKAGIPFLLGSDHYYNLGLGWDQNNPTPQYMLKMKMSMDTLQALGMPPAVLEMPAGSSCDMPPILSNDLKACYLSNLAVGMKGVNYYVFTGGQNFEDTGENRDLYDYGAPIGADNSIRDTYYAMKEFHAIAHDHAWMQHSHRRSSVQIGFEWNLMRAEAFDYKKAPFTNAQTYDFIMRGILYTLMCTRHEGRMVPLTGPLDKTQPLIVPAPSAMSEEAQKAILAFAEAGGKVLILPCLPETDLEYQPSSILRDALAEAEFEPAGEITPAMSIEGLPDHVFMLDTLFVCTKLPESARVTARDLNGTITGFEIPYGNGTLQWLGFSWMATTFPQAMMMETLLEHLGAAPMVESSNRNIAVTYWTDEKGHRTVFAMNLYSSPQKTRIHVLA